MIRWLPLFSICWLLASTAHAAICQFSALSDRESEAPYAVTVDWRLAPGVTVEDQKAVAATLAETDALLAGSVKGTGQVIVDLRPRISDAQMNHGLKGPILYLGLQDVATLAKPSSPTGVVSGTKHPKHARATWIHEYAHFYFKQMFETEFRQKVEKSADTTPAARAQLELRAELTKRSDEIFAKVEVLLEELESRPDKMTLTTPRTKQLDAEVRALLAETDKLFAAKLAIAGVLFAAKDSHVYQFSRLFAAFNELYADTVANFQLGDMNAMRDNLYFAGDDRQNQKSAESRGTRRSPVPWSMKDVHELTNESRVQLARAAGPYLRSPQSKQQFLALVTKCIKGEMDVWQGRSYKDITPEAINEGFIARFNQGLKELGPPK